MEWISKTWAFLDGVCIRICNGVIIALIHVDDNLLSGKSQFQDWDLAELFMIYMNVL